MRQQQASRHSSYIVGYDSKNNFFIVRENKFPEFKEGKEIIYHENFYSETILAQSKYEKFISRINSENKNKTIETKPKAFYHELGAVGIYQDQFGGHHCILIQNHWDNSAKFIFLTSNPKWNSRSRKTTKDERSLLGRPEYGHDNYFAPVTRPLHSFNALDFCYPEHRVQDLLAEFWHNY